MSCRSTGPATDSGLTSVEDAYAFQLASTSLCPIRTEGCALSLHHPVIVAWSVPVRICRCRRVASDHAAFWPRCEIWLHQQ